jgi:hypothetical protein
MGKSALDFEEVYHILILKISLFVTITLCIRYGGFELSSLFASIMASVAIAVLSNSRRQLIIGDP